MEASDSIFRRLRSAARFGAEMSGAAERAAALVLEREVFGGLRVDGEVLRRLEGGSEGASASASESSLVKRALGREEGGAAGLEESFLEVLRPKERVAIAARW